MRVLLVLIIMFFGLAFDAYGVDGDTKVYTSFSHIPEHNTITEYVGPETCIGCHDSDATEMLNSLHMTWSGHSPYVTNADGRKLGKASKGINTFCTYAMSSESTCFTCHVRSDGNAPHPPEKKDVDCLMCHSDVYQRKFVLDPNRTEIVQNVNGVSKVYILDKVDDEGNYFTEPDFDKMPPGTTMVDIARTVHMPTNKSCLRCHATAGGGDWTKRGDMGWSSANAPFEEDVHMSKDGANLSCVNCHSALDHRMGGRGIDLRQTEAPSPTCVACHVGHKHQKKAIQRHSEGQVSCQTCHIREFAKGGATEMSRDWRHPEENPGFASGQGGFVGEEIKVANVKPEYVWFDGTSYVYNVGDYIEPDERGVYAMAKANGTVFDGKAKIYPIKRHFGTMALLETGQIIPPAIIWMFMTGDFDEAVRKGMEEQGMVGNYTIVEADAEMLITHGVDPKYKAAMCNDCHNDSGQTPDGEKMLPFEKLGYHNFAIKVQDCSLCHAPLSDNWKSMHKVHRNEDISCEACHSGEPSGYVSQLPELCSKCHENKDWNELAHKIHIKKKVSCTQCHYF